MNCNDEPTSRQEDAVVRASARRTLDLGPKGMRKELLSPDEVTGIQMMRIEIRPGGAWGEASRNQSGAKCSIVMSGTLALSAQFCKCLDRETRPAHHCIPGACPAGRCSKADRHDVRAFQIEASSQALTAYAFKASSAAPDRSHRWP